MLPSGQPLHRALPDLDDLLQDPHAYLSEAPLALGPPRMYGLAGMFAVPGICFLLSCVLGKPDGERLAMGIGFLVGSAVWLGWSLLLRGHELVLNPDGIEVVFRESVVWAPWALFHVEGEPFVPESDSPRTGLMLPVNPAAVPYVELRRGGMVVAHGLQVSGPQWLFNGHGQVTLPARYEITAQDIGELLLWLGNQLGKDLPRNPPPPEAELPETIEVQVPDPEGWLTLPLVRLRLPSCCAGCGGPRDDTLPVAVRARGDWLWGPLFGARTIEVGVPVCAACRDRIANRQRGGGLLGMALGVLFGTLAGGAVGFWQGEGRDVPLMLGGFAGLFFGTLAGSLLGVTLSRRLPVRFRRFSPSRGTVSVRFDNPDIAARVIAELRERAKR
jgi:hypothetical protein